MCESILAGGFCCGVEEVNLVLVMMLHFIIHNVITLT
jgi:hypothetical protein